MNKMKKHDITGEAVFYNRPKSLYEKKNQAIQRKIQENQNIALVNYRLQIEKQKVDKMSRNLHLIDFANKPNHIKFVSSLYEIKDAKVKTNIHDQELERELSSSTNAMQGGNKFKLSMT